MHKKTTKSQRLTEKKPGREVGSARATASSRKPQRRSGEVINALSNNSLNVDRLSRLSSSWSHWTAGGQQGSSSSWSIDVEEVASHRLLEHWRAVERTLYDKEDQLPPGHLLDECVQWRNQLPHLRIVSRSLFDGPSDHRSGAASTSKANSLETTSQRNVVSSAKYKPTDFSQALFSREASFHSFNQQSYKQAREEVLEHIINFICKELAEIEAEKLAEEEEDLNENFNECLKIAPAPTCKGKNPLVSNSFYCNIENVDTPKQKEKVKEKELDLRTRRNKLGTVFNERIIVSPVPFIVTSRESFSTLRKTPILYIGENNDISNNTRSGSRRENTRRKLSLTGKTPLVETAPNVLPMWNTPVYPTIWPKNVKLSPIDTSRLPSRKKRPTKTAESVPPRRNRRSLSPISRSVQPTSPRSCTYDNQADVLEVHGSQIVAQERNWRTRNVSKINGVNSSLFLSEQKISN